MTRSTLSSLNRGEVTKPALRLEYLIRIVLPSITLRGATGDRDVTFGGNTYFANAKFNGFSGLTENPDLKARKTGVVLSGLDSTLVSAAMNDKYHFAEIDLYVAFFDESFQLVDTPHQIGVTLYTSSMTVSLGEASGTIQVEAETLEVLNRRNNAVLATPESQKRRYAGDTGMDRVRAILETEFEWGGRQYSSGIINDFTGHGPYVSLSGG